MFLPLDRKPDWKSPPLITLIIFIINVLFWYIWQANDIQNQTDTIDYYTSSGLYKPELKAYEKYKHIADKDKLTTQDYAHFSAPALKLMVKMRRDGTFQKKLDADEIIKPEDEGYLDWRSKRTKYDYLYNRVVGNKYGLTPSRPSIITYFTNMFLHASNPHLWWNMFFFVFTGYVVEMVLGRSLYLIGYLLSGLTAGWLYVLLFPNSAAPGIGASGAISGVMGMYIVLFGLRKVKFFYSLIVYFDYVKAPAILMSPFFILYMVVIPYFLNPSTNISAHLGGFLGGMLFAGVLKFIPGAVNIAYLDEDKNEDDFQTEYQQAMQLLAKMEIDEAREKFEALLRQHPNDINIKQQLYTISKYNPASEPYHRYATQLLNLPGSDRTTAKIVHDTFVEYASKAKPKPRWTPELMISMAVRFAAAGYLDDAEKLVNFLLKAKADYQRNPEGLASLVKYFNGKDKQKQEHYRQLLLSMYPESSEAQLLQRATNAASD